MIVAGVEWEKPQGQAPMFKWMLQSDRVIKSPLISVFYMCKLIECFFIRHTILSIQFLYHKITVVHIVDFPVAGNGMHLDTDKTGIGDT